MTSQLRNTINFDSASMHRYKFYLSIPVGGMFDSEEVEVHAANVKDGIKILLDMGHVLSHIRNVEDLGLVNVINETIVGNDDTLGLARPISLNKESPNMTYQDSPHYIDTANTRPQWQATINRQDPSTGNWAVETLNIVADSAVEVIRILADAMGPVGVNFFLWKLKPLRGLLHAEPLTFTYRSFNIRKVSQLREELEMAMKQKGGPLEEYEIEDIAFAVMEHEDLGLSMRDIFNNPYAKDRALEELSADATRLAHQLIDEMKNTPKQSLNSQLRGILHSEGEGVDYLSGVDIDWAIKLDDGNVVRVSARDQESALIALNLTYALSKDHIEWVMPWAEYEVGSPSALR